MGQQHRRTVKRRRRLDYIKRKKELAQASSTVIPVRLASVTKKQEQSAATEEKPVKKAPAKKAPAAKKEPVAKKEVAAKKAPAKKAPAKKKEASEKAE